MDTIYVDRMLRCRECGDEFVFSASEQAFYASKGLAHDPARCASCRAIARGLRSLAASPRGMAPERGRATGDRYQATPSHPPGAARQAPARRRYAAVCSACGGEALVPFIPRGDRPVYCVSCYAQHREAHG